MGALRAAFHSFPAGEPAARPAADAPPSLGGDAIAAAFAVLPKAPPTCRKDGAFAGSLRRSFGKAAYMRVCKDRIRALRQGKGTAAMFDSLATAWNSTVLREGDQVQCRHGSGGPRCHPNAYKPDAVIREAFRYVGLCRGERRGVFGTSHRCAMASVVAEAAEREQAARAASALSGLIADGSLKALALHKSYDCTPTRVRSGALQGQLAPAAR